MNQQAGVKAASLTTSTLACGGLDDASNMQWQTVEEARAKDKW